MRQAREGGAGPGDTDPFSRRPTRLSTYYTISGSKEVDLGEEDKEDDARRKEEGVLSKKRFVRSHTTIQSARIGYEKGREMPVTTKVPHNNSQDASATQLNELILAHNVHMHIDPSTAILPDHFVSAVAKSMVPILHRGHESGGLLAGLYPVPPLGKSLTLQEYKVRQGLE